MSCLKRLRPGWAAQWEHAGVPHTERRRVLVLLSTGGEMGLAKALTLLIEKAVGRNHDLEVKEIACDQEFRAYAAHHPVDLFIVLLNNIRLKGRPGITVAARVEAALQFISELKRSYGKGVIAMTGWWPGDEASFAEKALTAGADFGFLLAPAPNTFVEAVERCLRR